MGAPGNTVLGAGTARRLAAGATAIATLIAAGCALQSPPKPEDIRAEALGTMDLQTPWRAGDSRTAAVGDNWLASFGDLQLDALVAEAIVRNPDLRVAAARVEQATEYLNIARAAQRPTVSIAGTGGIKLTDLSSALTGVIALVSWELDLWGALRYGKEAAAADLSAAQSDSEFARQSLAATTAKAWFTATQTLNEQQLAAEMVGASEHLVRLATERQRVGAGSAQDIALAESALGFQRDTLAQARYAHQAALRAIELLLGRYPAAELRARTDLPPLPGPVPAGLPLQMLERRPDLVAAERRVAAAFSRVGQAKAAQLPSIRLTGNLGYIDSDIVQLKQDYDNPSAGLGLKFVAPIYTGGALQAQTALRTAQQREAVAQYARIALRAIGDVETALASSQVLAERDRILTAVIGERRRALEYAQASYRVGRLDLRSVEEQQLNLYGANVQLLRVRSEQLSQRVALHLALGGKF